jgi:hypothetical protein
VRSVGRGERWGATRPRAALRPLERFDTIAVRMPLPVRLWSFKNGHGWLSSYRNTDESRSVLRSKGVRSRGLDPTVQRDMLWENVRHLYGIAS